MLSLRKITKKRLQDILSARHINNPYKKLADLPSPMLFKDIKKATKRVKQAIANNESITIVGDYDVDGIVSTAIMVEFFLSIGYPVNQIIPNRFEHGYGISSKIIDEINSDIIITVDNGISAFEAAGICKERGIDLIITDHHTVGDKLPDAFAIINPKQEECTFPFKEICGAQVAWYFCAAIKQELNIDIKMGEFLDLLTIAIIADIMPMTSLNYTMVKIGLKRILSSSRVALQELNKLMQKATLNSDDIGYFIAPKINSAGRMDDASVALSFLLSQDSFEAAEILDFLNELNEDRKKLQEQIVLEAIDAVDDKDSVIVVWGDDWHEGIIGIVASRLATLYKKPAFIFSVKGGIAKGSARANAQLSLYEMLSNIDHDLLLGFGGHKGAAGLSLNESNLENFKIQINQIANNLSQSLYTPEETLGEIDVSEVDLEFLSIIQNYEPYGLENKKPIFKISNAKIIKNNRIGKEKNHLKLLLDVGGVIFEAIEFHTKFEQTSQTVDLIVSISKNEYRGTISPQFMVKEINSL